MCAMRSLVRLLAFTVLAWFITSTGWAMLVDPPRGDSVATADQQRSFAADTARADAAAFDFRVSQFEAAQHCAPVQSWKRQHPGAIPARMVEHTDGSGVLRVVPWTYPAAPGQWVVGLCAR